MLIDVSREFKKEEIKQILCARVKAMKVASKLSIQENKDPKQFEIILVHQPVIVSLSNK